MNGYAIYSPYDILQILEKMPLVWCKEGQREKHYTLNAAISFDIETSSIISEHSEKIAFMYAWAFDIDDKTILGRTWQEFTDMLQVISNYLGLNEHKKIICYIHNLAFEFAFLAPLFNWTKVFATDPRKPLYAECDLGIEFRCSYRLTGYALEKIGEQVGIEKTKDLDYDLIRHFATPLSYLEKQYIAHDVKIVSECIRQKIKEENGIIHIPLTKTGYVRRLFRVRCLHGKYASEYLELIARLKMTVDEYAVMHKCFMGGFTHANPRASGKVQKNVESYDICSSYPTSLICKKFPMGAGKFYKFKSRKHLEKEMYSTEYAYIFQIELKNVKPIFTADNYISYSKCIEIENAVKNNGRIFSADRLVTTITNIDYQIIEKCYTFDIGDISNSYRYYIDYLPKPFIETLLELYRYKTILKDVDGMEKEYMNAKENINSAFGMCVMNIVRDLIDFCGEWYVNGKPQSEFQQLTKEQQEQQLIDENKKRGRFLFYAWGVFVTAYSRLKLWKAILELGNDYLYSDTDSVKFTNAIRHRVFFKKENESIIREIKTALRHHGIDEKYIKPKTKEGIEKPLGIWEFDGAYSEFKTIGAKRYLFRYSDDTRNKEKNRGKYVLTVAGLSKKKALDYILTKKKPFTFFRIGMYIPAENTGKLTHTYIDDVRKATVTDYTGITKNIIARSGVHLSKQDYKCSIARDYADFLKGKHDFFTK